MQVTGTIPNLINGVSQQAPALRLPSQAEEQENLYSTLVDGLIPRPRTDWLSKLVDTFPSNAFTHFILRDSQERYVVTITNEGAIRVFGIDGIERTVDNQAPEYLQGTDDTELELKALTIADFTFIANTKKVVQTRADLSPSRPFEALYYVNSGNYSKTYSILRDNVLKASFTTPDSSDVTHEPFVDTTYIANQLFTGLAVGASQAKGRYHSTIYFRDTDTDFTTSIQDGYGGRAFKAIKTPLQKFSDLPIDGPDGFVTEIAGSDTTGFDNYWVALKQGVWKETIAPSTRLGFDKNTMPHALVRNGDGSFTFKALDWNDRTVGNVDKVPDPSFVGKRIQDVFFYRNRLGFLTEENTVLSESGRFYNFYRTTMTTALDTDPVDVSATHTKVSLLHHAVPTRDNLIIFSDQTQFRVAGNELFTPRTVSARPLTELSAAPLIRPVASKTDIYFVAEQAGFALLQEFFIERDGLTADVDTPSNHVPAYLPSGVTHMACSPELDLVLMISRGDPAQITVYKYYFQGNEKVQSAWSKWSFPNSDRVVNMTFDKGSLLVLLSRGGDLHLERLRCEQRTVDAPLTFSVGLDQHYVVRDNDTFTYDPTTDQTSIPLPYHMPFNMVLVSDLGGTIPFGVEYKPLNPRLEVPAPDWTPLVARVKGDVRGQPFRIGTPFKSRYVFSPFFYRAQSAQSNGRTAVNENGRLQIMNLNIVYARTAYFTVTVTCDGRLPRTYPISGRRLSSADNRFNEVVLSDGHCNIPIYSRNDRVRIEITNDTWLPCAFESAEWRGAFHPNTREL